MFITVLGSLTSLCVCIAVGFLCRKIKIINDEVNAGLTNILVKVTLPCTVLTSLRRPFSKDLLVEGCIVLAVSFCIFLFGGLVALLLAKLLHAKPDEKNIWIFSLIFANVGYMGFPVTQAVFGENSLFYTSMANISFNLLAFTLGIELFRKKGKEKAQLKAVLINPAIIATAVGIVFFVTSAWFLVPDPVCDGIAMLGGMTSPLSMLVVGGILAKGDIRQVFKGYKMYVLIFVRLLALPVLSFFVLRPFIKNPMMLGVLVLLVAMPIASLTAIYAEQYKGNSILASKLVFVSTLLCIFTLPFVSLLLPAF